VEDVTTRVATRPIKLTIDKLILLPVGVCLQVLYLVVKLFHHHILIVLVLWILTISLHALTNGKEFWDPILINTVCQMCYAIGHSANTCPNCYHPHQQSVLRAYAMISFVDAGEQVWYLDSSAVSRMTPNDDMLLINLVLSKFGMVC